MKMLKFKNNENFSRKGNLIAFSNNEILSIKTKTLKGGGNDFIITEDLVDF